MVATRAFGTGLVTALGLGIIVGACTDDGFDGPSDAGTDAPFIDAGGNDNDEPDAGDHPDAGDVSPPDTTPPDRVTDLAASAVSHASVNLTWTAPADDAGMVAGYELRYARTPISTLAEFTAATSATAPGPLAPGSEQTATVTGLTPDTEYHFAIRARDAAGNFGELSSVAV
ncbi:MAG: fibronectin type III domain-containing protein, partial [Solirubrobacterales bacterium]|nr:fibronectin type III domain-containing protein [Solirubrobacterales bacterium]